MDKRKRQAESLYPTMGPAAEYEREALDAQRRAKARGYDMTPEEAFDWRLSGAVANSASESEAVRKLSRETALRLGALREAAHRARDGNVGEKGRAETAHKHSLTVSTRSEKRK